jgi:hypothetical protein
MNLGILNGGVIINVTPFIKRINLNIALAAEIYAFIF